MAQFIQVVEVQTAPEQVMLHSITIATAYIASWSHVEANKEKELGVDEGCEANYYIRIKMANENKMYTLRHTEKELVAGIKSKGAVYNVVNGEVVS